ncbi:hypothetical protein D2962_08130 [Biomaibacter acetigenes]|uniref:Uncharacterized protein n=1 Tax=Biomaibacter acetigenes TaxID=2316383 RepID=A0A3G2R5E0_9FIRM|nr:hypothetical protein [Biomaibacter acetigenes]AYO30591.1 hypothetical protein D2962_08130 [Biomaibacter acetigenes]
MTELPKTLAEAEIKPGVFLFPGRWEGELREMTTAEEDMLLNRRQGREWEAINKVLQACLLTPGVDVMNMLVGDRVFALLQLRRITYGDAFVFRVTCPRCNARFEWEENLGDLKIKYLEDPEHAKPEHTFTFTLPKSGKVINWRMLRGKDEQKMATMRRDHPDALMTSIMLLRVVEIEGEKMVTRKAFAELPASDAAAFRGEVEAKECGIDTAITVECPECWNAFDMDLPMAGQGFLLPTGRSRR